MVQVYVVKSKFQVS